MNKRFWRFSGTRILGFSLVLLAIFAATHQLTTPLWKAPEIVLALGGTYEDLRKYSTIEFSPLRRGRGWFGIPKDDARLRFTDPLYGFETPLARFFTVSFDENIIVDVVMSPQIEPLLIDDALKVVLDLQAQWCAKGWVPVGTRKDPTITDNPEWRFFLRKGILAGRSF